MKEQFLSKWSNWWSLTRDAKQLNEAFARELNELIQHELALRQPPVSGMCACTTSQCYKMNGKYICATCNKPIHG